MATKANHHYIPQFYLRGFSGGFGRKSQVFVFDSDTKKSFTTLTRNIGSSRHFNRVDALNVDPNHLEDAMSEIESEIAPHLQEVIEAKKFPSRQHFFSIMNLMALLSVRNPRLRENMSNLHVDLVERMMSLSVSSKEIWTAQERKMREAGQDLNSSLTYEEVKRFHEGKNYIIRIDQTHLIKLELEMFEPVLEQLSRRSWCFAIASEGHQFITCDDPTVLTWNEKVRQPIPYSPGHGLQNSIVFFTLSTEVALVGMFEDLPQTSAYSFDQVAAVNTAIARHSRNQIYAQNGDFTLHLKNRQFVKGRDLSKVFLKR